MKHTSMRRISARRISNLVIIVLLLCVLPACAPKFSVVLDKTRIQEFVGTTVKMSADYASPQGNVTDPALVANCENIQITGQNATVGPKGKVVANVLVNNFGDEKDCLIFRSKEHEEVLPIRVSASRQGSIRSIDFPKQINYGAPAKMTVKVDILKTEAPLKLKVSFSSTTPNLRFAKSSNETVGMDQAEVEFTTGEYQDTALPYGTFILPDPGFSMVSLAPISVKLSYGEAGTWYVIDEAMVSGMVAKQAVK